MMLCSSVSAILFLSTPSARRATPTRFYRRLLLHISIHALREEGDVDTFVDNLLNCYFYPRPPRGGRLKPIPKIRYPIHFYPRPPRGGRLVGG